MPKMKTKKSAAKRFSRTKTGKFKAKKAFGAHLLTNKSPKRRRNFRAPAVMSKADTPRIAKMLPYG